MSETEAARDAAQESNAAYVKLLIAEAVEAGREAASYVVTAKTTARRATVARSKAKSARLEAMKRGFDVPELPWAKDAAPDAD